MGGDIIAAVAIVIIIGLAVGYIIKAKRSGQKCIGCPDSKTCSGHCAGCNGACGGAVDDGNKEN